MMQFIVMVFGFLTFYGCNLPFLQQNVADDKSAQQGKAATAKKTAVAAASPELLRNFTLDGEDMFEVGDVLPDGVLVIDAQDIPANLVKFRHSDGMIYILYERADFDSLDLAAGPSFAAAARARPVSKAVADAPGVPPLKHLQVNPELDRIFSKIQQRTEFFRRSGIQEVKDPADITRAQRFADLIDDVKESVSEAEIDEVFSEVNWRIENTGILAPNGLISFLDGKSYASIDSVYQANFAKLDRYLENPALRPTEMWELFRSWPWPSDHLPAVSQVELDGMAGSMQVGTMNLLKKGFDDNRLQTSQGLGGQLASRHLHLEDPDIRVDSSANVKPSAAAAADQAPIKRAPRPNWRIFDSATKDWDLPTIRERSQLKFIESRMAAGEIDLLGLNEVTAKQLALLKSIGGKHSFTAIGTESGRRSRDLISGQIDPDLLDHGVILVNTAKFDIEGDPLVSNYVDPKTNRANKHITSVLLRDKSTGHRFVFTNTHADFGEIGTLGEHHAKINAAFGDSYENIIVGDMNHSSDGVLTALEKHAAGQNVTYSDNTPAHVGFSRGKEGSVVDYDQVFLISDRSGSKVAESSEIGQWHRQYASSYEQEFADASRAAQTN